MERIVDLKDDELRDLDAILDRHPYPAVQDFRQKVKDEIEDREMIAQLKEALFPHDELY